MAQIEDPNIATDHAAANLPKIIEQAGAIEIETKKILTSHEEGKRAAMGAQEEARRASTPNANAGGNIEAGVYADIAAEGLGGSAVKLIKDGIDFLKDRGNGGFDLAEIAKKNPLISAKASTLADFGKPGGAANSFSLSERTQNTSQSLTGYSAAMKDKIPAQTQEMGGRESFESASVKKIANQQKLDMARRLQRENSAELAHRQRVGGMTPAMAPQASLANGPSFSMKELVEEETNWAGTA